MISGLACYALAIGLFDKTLDCWASISSKQKRNPKMPLREFRVEFLAAAPVEEGTWLFPTPAAKFGAKSSQGVPFAFLLRY